MRYGRGWGYAAAVVVAALMLGKATASAQVSFIGPATHGVCVPATECMSNSDCEEVLGHSEFTCERPPDVGSAGVCRPPRSAFCCSVASTDAERECPAGQVCEALELSAVLTVGVCVPRARSYCSGGGPAMKQCHTAPGGAFPVAYEHGDCDEDGVPNGMERSVCDGPPEIGIVDGGGCPLIERGCERAQPCSGGDCELLSDESATYCHPERDVLFCCPDGACPGSLACTPFDDMLSVCVPPECGGNLACVTDAAGNPVPFTKGDCDGDGVPNGDEPGGRADLCPLPDGGVPTEDAGPARDAGTHTARDAGPQPDASTEFDGGPASPAQPSFAGGGGCVCRGAPGRSGSTPWLALAPLALLLATRRR